VKTELSAFFATELRVLYAEDDRVPQVIL